MPKHKYGSQLKTQSVSKTKTNQFMQFREINAVYSHNEIIPVHIVWVKSSFWMLNCVCVCECAHVQVCMHMYVFIHTHTHIYCAFNTTFIFPHIVLNAVYYF